MTTATTDRPTDPSPVRPSAGADLAQIWAGIRTVARMELRQRVRTSRWRLVLVVWAAVVYGIVALLWAATRNLDDTQRGVVCYSVTIFLVLGLGMLVMPSLTATSINGDREQGVLAILQVTLLSPAQIVLGKLLAAWAVAGVFLLIAAPVLVAGLIFGGVELGPLLLAVLTLVVVMTVVCALGMLFSSLTARTVTSVVLTYLTVGFFVFGTLILFGVTTPLTEEDVTQRVQTWPAGGPDMTNPDQPQTRCIVVNREAKQIRTDKTWWLLALNPFVVVADAAPSNQAATRRSLDPMGEISLLARSARRGPQPDRLIYECVDERTPSFSAPARDDVSGVAPLWPVGLLGLALIGAGSVAVAIRRVRTPVHRLPAGTRIA